MDPALVRSRDFVESTVAQLAALPNNRRSRGDVDYAHQFELGERVTDLSRRLQAMLLLLDHGAIETALTGLRAALEHTVFDRLLLLADRVERTYTTSAETAEELVATPPRDALAVYRHKRGVTIVWQQHIEWSDSERTTFSPYYGHWKNFEPFRPRTSEDESVAAGFAGSSESRREWERRSRDIWDTSLTWRSLRTNLVLNGLNEYEEVRRLDVYYRYLSAFAHPLSQQAKDSLTRRTFGRFDTQHLVQEFALCFVAFLTSWEMKTYLQFADRPPEFDVDNRSEIVVTIESLDSLSSAIWPVGGHPTEFDRRYEANQRFADIVNARIDDDPIARAADIVPDPASLTDAEVRPYWDPLKRLADIHNGFSELTTGMWWRGRCPIEHGMAL